MVMDIWSFKAAYLRLVVELVRLLFGDHGWGDSESMIVDLIQCYGIQI